MGPNDSLLHHSNILLVKENEQFFIFGVSPANYGGATCDGPLEPQLACKASEPDHYKAN